VRVLIFRFVFDWKSDWAKRLQMLKMLRLVNELINKKWLLLMHLRLLRISLCTTFWCISVLSDQVIEIIELILRRSKRAVLIADHRLSNGDQVLRGLWVHHRALHLEVLDISDGAFFHIQDPFDALQKASR